MIEDYLWYLIFNYGFLLKSSDVKLDNYLFFILFCDYLVIIY